MFFNTYFLNIMTSVGVLEIDFLRAVSFNISSSLYHNPPFVLCYTPRGDLAVKRVLLVKGIKSVKNEEQRRKTNKDNVGGLMLSQETRGHLLSVVPFLSDYCLARNHIHREDLDVVRRV